MPDINVHGNCLQLGIEDDPVAGSTQSHARADLPVLVKPYCLSDAPDKNTETDCQQQKAGAADSGVPNISCGLKHGTKCVSL